MPFDELRAAVLALPVEERCKLAEDIWESVEAEALNPPPQWMIDELERREAHARANPDSLRPWSEVYARLKARYGG